MSELGRLRSLLFAPATRPDFLDKLGGRGADAVCIDLEDATPAERKAEGRDNARLATQCLAEQVAVTIRVNDVTMQWFADDVTAALSPELVAVVVPKVESIGGLDAVAGALEAAGFGSLGVIAGLETAQGVALARDLLAHERVVAAYFGAEDFVADMGGIRTESNIEVQYARSEVALAGRLAEVPVLDQVVADIGNTERFVAEAKEARAMGYAGKLCVHPNQVGLANEAFIPSEAEVDRARRLVVAYEAALEGGQSAIEFEGQMVDAPVVARARQLLAKAPKAD